MPYYVRLNVAPLPTATSDFVQNIDVIGDALSRTPGIVGNPRLVTQSVSGRLVRTGTILVSTPSVSVRDLNLLQDGIFRRLDAAIVGLGIAEAQAGRIWEVKALPYDPATDGSVEWWRTAAANTQTRNSTNPGYENPLGPTVVGLSVGPVTPIRPVAGPGPAYLAYIIKSEDRFVLNAPTKEVLDSIFNRVPKGAGVTWLGNVTRITRFGQGSGIVPVETYAVRVAHFSDTSRSGTQAAALLWAIEDIIRRDNSAYGFEPPVVSAIDPRFGSPSFWTSGQAGVTRTWRTSDLFGAEENPFGPNDPAMRPTTMAEWLGNAGDQAASSVLWPIAIAVGVAALVYFLGPTGRAVSTSYAEQIEAKTAERRQARKARKNPRRRRHPR